MPQIGSQIGQQLLLQVAGLTLVLDTVTVAVELRDKLDPADNFAGLPVLIVAPAEGGKEERLVGTCWRVANPWVVALVTSGRQDFAAQIPGELGSALDWRYQLAKMLREPGALGLAAIHQVEVDRRPIIDPGFAEKGLDVSAIKFTFTGLEDLG